MARHKPDWSQLYTELLTSIATHLETRDDFRHFRSVCKNWRFSSLIIPGRNLPYLSPLFPHEFSSIPKPLTHSKNYSLIIVANSTFLLQPKNPNPNHKLLQPWLITVEELDRGRLYLRKPLTSTVIQEFPENSPRILNLSDCNVIEIRRDYNLRYVENFPSYKSFYRCWRNNIDKVVLFFNPSSITPSVNDCFALALDDRELLFVRLNNENNYGYLRCGHVSKFDDIVNYKGCVWAIDRKGMVYALHYNDNLKMVRLSRDDGCTVHVGDRQKRLVGSYEGLYLIDRYHYEELIKFRVYKLNEEDFKWREIKSLGDRILFVLTDCCFFCSAELFPGCGGNCIFFPKDHFPTYFGRTHPDKLYFKGASNELEVGVFHLDDGESGIVSTYPGYSDILWPPPKWLLPGWNGEDEEDGQNIPNCNEEICPSFSSMEDCFSFASSVQEKFDEISAYGRQFQGADISWTDIPSKLLTEIAKYLKNHIDVTRFRAVCKKWRASLPPPLNSNLLCSLLPYKISSYSTPFIEMSYVPEVRASLCLVASTVYLIQPCDQSLIASKSWLVTLEEVNRGKLFLRLPLRKVAIKALPENFPKVLSLSGLRVLELAREYNFRYAYNTWGVNSSIDSNSLHKVVLSSSSVLTSNTIDNAPAMVLYGKGNLALFELQCQDWEPIRHGSVTNFDDMLNFKGMVYAIDRKGRVYIISCNTREVRRITNDVMGTGHGYRQKRLVESGGKLFLLVRYSPEEKIYFRIYRLNEEQRKWDEVRSLGKNILFVTPSVCFFASARDCPGWKGNCVVFPANCLPSYSGNTYPDRRFFRRTIAELEIGVFHLGETDGAKLIKCYPGYSDLFWPPPAWLQSYACSSSFDRNGLDSPYHHQTQEEERAQLSELLDGQIVEYSSNVAQQSQ